MKIRITEKIMDALNQVKAYCTLKKGCCHDTTTDGEACPFWSEKAGCLLHERPENWYISNATAHEENDS